MDQLPTSLTDPLRGALIARLEPVEIVRAFGVAVECLLDEVRRADPPLATRIEPALRDLLESTEAAIATEKAS